MSKAPDDTRTSILVALDESPLGLEALEAAATLAADTHARLQGLFVEDVNLLRLAGLPFASEVVSRSAARRTMTLPEIESRLRESAEAVRRSFELAARRCGAPGTFSVARGQLTRESLMAAAAADLLIMAQQSLSIAVAQTRKQTLRPILVVADAGAAIEGALSTALRLGGPHSSLVVVADPADQERRGQLLAHASRWLAARGLQAVAERQVAGVPGLLAVAREYQARLVLANRDDPLFDEAAIEVLVSELACPLALARTR